jgi:hypothetical protein
VLVSMSTNSVSDHVEMMTDKNGIFIGSEENSHFRNPRFALNDPQSNGSPKGPQQSRVDGNATSSNGYRVSLGIFKRTITTHCDCLAALSVIRASSHLPLSPHVVSDYWKHYCVSKILSPKGGVLNA